MTATDYLDQGDPATCSVVLRFTPEQFERFTGAVLDKPGTCERLEEIVLSALEAAPCPTP